MVQFWVELLHLFNNNEKLFLHIDAQDELYHLGAVGKSLISSMT